MENLWCCWSGVIMVMTMVLPSLWTICDCGDLVWSWSWQWWYPAYEQFVIVVIWCDHGYDNDDTQPMENLWCWSGMIMVITMMMPSLWRICDAALAWSWSWQWWYPAYEQFVIVVIWRDHGHDNGDTQPMNNLWLWWSGVIMVMTMVIPSLWTICDCGDLAWSWSWQWWYPAYEQFVIVVIWRDHGNDNGDTQPMENLWLWWSGVIMVMTMVIPSLWTICDCGDLVWSW